MKTAILLTLCLLSGILSVRAQSSSAELKLKEIYTPSQIEDMQSHDPGKYNSLVWYFAHSWNVMEAGVARPATEAEILSVNIKPYDNVRKADEKVTVTDSESGLVLQLLSADDCWEELKAVLDPAQWQKMHDFYLFNKSMQENTNLSKSAN